MVLPTDIYRLINSYANVNIHKTILTIECYEHVAKTYKKYEQLRKTGHSVTYMVMATTGEGIASNIENICYLPKDIRYFIMAHNGLKGTFNKWSFKNYGSVTINKDASIKICMRYTDMRYVWFCWLYGESKYELRRMEYSGTYRCGLSSDILDTADTFVELKSKLLISEEDLCEYDARIMFLVS